MVAIDPKFAISARQEPAKRFALTRSDQRFLLFALGALFAVRLLAMFWWPFTDSTEARYAEIARKMVETGDWITPQFDYGVPFWAKPPLHTWLSGPVAFLCRPTCSFRPLSFRKRPGFSNPVLSAAFADCRSR